MSNSNIVRGAMLLTAASFLSKFLGMIYVIPFHGLVGETGGTLYNFAYTPYTIFISLSTVGIPLAVSKFVSKYNSLGDYKTGMQMFRTGMKVMAVTGILAFLILFFSAETLANLQLSDASDSGITASDVAYVIRMVSFALLIIPIMSIFRGFFQGHESMGPTAVSQVIEQIVRIIFLLGASFLVIHVFDGSITTAVGLSTFAAFIGAMAALAILWGFWNKRKKHIHKRIQEQRYTNHISQKDMVSELFRYAGPFVLVGLAIPFYQLTDQFTFERAMVTIGQGNIWDIAYSAINLYGHKLVIIPVTLATGLSLAIIPAITNSFTQKNMAMVNQQINQAIQIILVLVIPAAIGLSMLSNEAYASLYNINNIDITGPLLKAYAPVAILFALYSVTGAILQGINQQRFAVISLFTGLLIKILLNIQLIYLFGATGAIIGTALAVGTSVLINLWRIKSVIQFSFKDIYKRTLLIGIFIMIMAVTIWLLKTFFGLFIPYDSTRWGSLVMLIISVLGGGLVYLWFAYKSTLLERILGDRVRILDKIFRW
ncbi:oligosaccharide flippase family protein [Ornithinibacillus sp. L9]|uniref:Oligosaccharide flippase family protein n=1 Tax=Ornithinibacillus caprae TaxID=2678566 RepID=A0A6N8FGE2_9BACI|nr:polysaccharide biosynthesis protein [Ornithinibacillus caprae]MUK86789.1 oligosaccharide flippase family protein [Ornithinibacillus caprae]